MPSTPKSKPEGLLGLTQQEARLMLLGILYTDTSGKVDYDKIAVNASYKNASSASVSYRAAKKKLYAQISPDGNANTSTSTENPGQAPGFASAAAPVKRTPAKRKKASAPSTADVNADAATEGTPAEGADEAFSTPGPKQKRRKAAAVAAKEQDFAMKEGEAAVKTVTELDQTMTISPLKPKQSSLNNSSKYDSQDAPINLQILSKTEEEQKEEEELMTQLSIETEFAAMERSRQLEDARVRSAWLAELPDAV
ncbi:hypothetical protein BDV18DRAFT_142898 [Aspergillus unguis]